MRYAVVRVKFGCGCDGGGQAADNGVVELRNSDRTQNRVKQDGLRCGVMANNEALGSADRDGKSEIGEHVMSEKVTLEIFTDYV